MSTAILCGLIILITLIIMLIAGVPIAVALGVSSVCAILPIMDFDVAVLTGAQRIFSGISVFSLLAIPFFILAGNIMNKGGIAIRIINLAKVITGRTPGRFGTDQCSGKHAVRAIPWSGTAAASAWVNHRPDREGRGLRPELLRSSKRSNRSDGSADSAEQRYDYLLSGIRRRIGCSTVHGRLHPRHSVGSRLYGSGILHGKEARLSQHRKVLCC